MTATPRRARTRREPRRAAMLVLVVVVLVGLGFVSVATSTAAPTAQRPSAAAVPGSSAESSSAFCAGLETDPGVVSSEVTIANTAPVGRTLELTASDQAGRSARRLVGLRAGRALHLDPATLLRAPVDALTIVADGGGVVATEAIAGPDGTAVAPCLTSTASSWWLTGGSTEDGHSLTVSIYNPAATTAVATVVFQTPSSLSVPTRYHGFAIGPHRLVVIVVHRVAPNRSPITTSVTTESGEVVVYGVARATKGAPSVSLLPGSPATATTAAFPVSPNRLETRTTLLLSNPSTTSVTATVAMTWAPGCGQHCAAPFSVTVAPGALTTLQVAPSDRVLGAEAAAAVSASSPGLVMVQRVRTTGSLGQAAPLDDPSGTGATQLALVDPTTAGFHRVSILNTTASAVTVTLATPGPHGEHVRRTVQVAAHGVTTLPDTRLAWLRGGVLWLSSTGPVYATGTVRDALAGSDLLPAVPVGSG